MSYRMGGYPHPNEKENYSAGPLWGGFDHKVPDFVTGPFYSWPVKTKIGKFSIEVVTFFAGSLRNSAI